MQLFELIRVKKNAAAFTLVEVMVSSLIGTIIFTALFYGLSQGNYIIQVDRENLRATQIMIGKLEGIRFCTWGSTNSTSQLFNTNYVSTSFVDYFYPSSIGNSSNGVVGGTVYTGTVTIQTNVAGGANNFTFYGSGTNTPTPPSYSNQIALVTVTLTWSDKHYGRVTTFNRSMKTYVAEYGLQNYISGN